MRVLIVGGGIGGMAAAVQLAAAGHGIDLIDLDPEWRVYGAGITITGPTLRAYRRLGLLDAIKAHGAVTKGARIYRHLGDFLQEFDEPVIEEGLPATGGIMRPVLHRLMQDKVAEAGVAVRLGLTVAALDQAADGVTVTLSDGASERFDLVVGADGIASTVTGLVWPDAPKAQETGQACWRVSVRRPPGFDRGEFYLGGPNPAGITACSPDDIYMWLLTPHVTHARVEDDVIHDRLRHELAGYGGTVGWIRDTMTDDDWVNYRPLAANLLPLPWASGRVVVLGDAAHATTPHLASGAGMAVEDALVLADELAVAGRGVEDSLLAYGARRYPRCRDVVETSLAVGRMQLDGASPEAVGARIGGALHRLAAEY